MKKILLIVLMSLIGICAWSGTQGHGGLSVVCRDPKTRAIDESRLQMLDLKEGQAIYGLAIAPNAASADSQIQEVISRLSFDPLLVHVFREEMDRLRRGMEFSSPDVGLERLPDVSLIPSEYLGRDCKIEQIAIYSPEGRLRVNSDLYDKLNNQNLAALFTHEVVYKMNRTSTAVDRSVEAREMTARLFSQTFDVEGFRRLAEKKLPTLSSRLGNGKIKLQLINNTEIELVFSGWFVMDGLKIETSTVFGHNESFAQNCDCGPAAAGTHFSINSIRSDEMPYATIGISNANKWVTFKQNGRALADDTGKTKFKISGYSSQEFVLLPPK